VHISTWMGDPPARSSIPLFERIGSGISFGSLLDPSDDDRSTGSEQKVLENTGNNAGNPSGGRGKRAREDRSQSIGHPTLPVLKRTGTHQLLSELARDGHNFDIDTLGEAAPRSPGTHGDGSPKERGSQPHPAKLEMRRMNTTDLIDAASALMDEPSPDARAAAAAATVASLSTYPPEAPAASPAISTAAAGQPPQADVTPADSSSTELKRTVSELVAEAKGITRAHARKMLDAMDAMLKVESTGGNIVMAPLAPAAVPQDPNAGRYVVMLRGKYKGRTAIIERKVKKKWRMRVEGVDYGLEFYDTMFKTQDGKPLIEADTH